MLLKALIVSLLWTDWPRHTSSLIELSQKTNPCPRKQKHVPENNNNLPSQATRLALFCGAFLLLSQKWISKQGERIVWRKMIFLFDFQYILGYDLLNIVDILHKFYTFTFSSNGSEHRGEREFLSATTSVEKYSSSIALQMIFSLRLSTGRTSSNVPIWNPKQINSPLKLGFTYT